MEKETKIEYCKKREGNGQPKYMPLEDAGSLPFISPPQACSLTKGLLWDLSECYTTSHWHFFGYIKICPQKAQW